MAISDKTRKILWGRSASRCSICKIELVKELKVSSDDTSIVGDECHIVSRRPDGPRGNIKIDINYDNYDNLILMCKNHHKLIDDFPFKYIVEKLNEIKEKHENWVKCNLKNGAIKIGGSNEVGKEKIDEYIFRVLTGKKLLLIICEAHFYDFSNTELENKEEVDLIGYFSSVLQDWGDIIEECDLGKVIEIEFELKKLIKMLDENGFWVFGSRMKRRLKIDGDIDLWDVAVIRIVRDNDPTIIKIDFKENISE
ncbi:MAG: HNH endonuclease signature motif containing protein [Candidatus Humimicrobiia bacterium]